MSVVVQKSRRAEIRPQTTVSNATRSLTPLLVIDYFHWQVIFSDTFFLGVFTFEALVKIVTMGFVGNERCYLREVWNR